MKQSANSNYPKTPSLLLEVFNSQTCVSRILSWFDVAAELFIIIKDIFPAEELLTSYYFARDDSKEKTNPNLDALEDVAMSVGDFVLNRWDISNSEKASKAVAGLQELINSFELQPWGAEKQNEMTPYYAALMGIDIACQNRRSLYDLDVAGPLNRGRTNEKVGVYLKPRPPYINRLMADSGIERIFENKINDQLVCMAFYENLYGQTMSLPRVVNVSPPSTVIMPSDTVPLTIGVAAFSGEMIIGDDASNCPVSKTPVGGALFGIKYEPGYDQRYAKGVVRAVDEAISNGCHILVFPEIVITRGLREVISNKLASTSSSSLLLVIAGSTWENGNNVCHIYDGWGNEIGTYYKRSPFEEGASTSRPNRPLSVEGLTNPGKRCTLVNVRGIGVVLPSICRDLVAEDAHTVHLARAFRPVIICCPAYSASLDHAFEQPIGDVVERSLSMVCIANCCGARPLREYSEIEITRIAAPGYTIYADGSYEKTHQASVEQKGIVKSADCQASCDNDGSCLFVTRIDYRLKPGSAAVLPIVDVFKPSCHDS